MKYVSAENCSGLLIGRESDRTQRNLQRWVDPCVNSSFEQLFKVNQSVCIRTEISYWYQPVALQFFTRLKTNQMFAKETAGSCFQNQTNEAAPLTKSQMSIFFYFTTGLCFLKDCIFLFVLETLSFQGVLLLAAQRRPGNNRPSCWEIISY